MIEFISLIKQQFKKTILRKQWRKLNQFNQTYQNNVFDPKIVKVGAMSYGPLEVYSWNSENESLVIGNYVSIASGVKFILGGNHYYDTFSTYPFKVKLGLEINEAYSNGPIIVEDDVWIGTDSLILSGVTIGKGAVIAARSVIVKDVPPYSIVGGNPAKVIKMRFESSIINELMDVNFSTLIHDNIVENIDLFYKPLDKVTLKKIIDLLIKKNS